MAATGLDVFDKTLQTTNIWLEEIMEVIIHVGMYAGWPCISHAIKQYHEVLAEDPKAQPRAPDASGES